MKLLWLILFAVLTGCITVNVTPSAPEPAPVPERPPTIYRVWPRDDAPAELEPAPSWNVSEIN